MPQGQQIQKEERQVKKPMPKKNVLEEQFEAEMDDCELLPEETVEQPHTLDDEYEETTEEITEDDFLRFKEDLPADWEG